MVNWDGQRVALSRVDGVLGLGRLKGFGLTERIIASSLHLNLRMRKSGTGLEVLPIVYEQRSMNYSTGFQYSWMMTI